MPTQEVTIFAFQQEFVLPTPEYIYPERLAHEQQIPDSLLVTRDSSLCTPERNSNKLWNGCSLIDWPATEQRQATDRQIFLLDKKRQK